MTEDETAVVMDLNKKRHEVKRKMYSKELKLIDQGIYVPVGYDREELSWDIYPPEYLEQLNKKE